MLPDFHYLRSPGIEHGEIVYLHDSLQGRHLIFAQAFPDDIIHEQYLRLGMIDQMMDIPRLEFMQDRHRHCTISKGGNE